MKHLIVILLVSNAICAQNFRSHQWKDRIIVISADKANSKLAESQFNVFNAEKEKCLDRKMVLYKCIENSCVFYNWQQEPNTFNIKNTSKGFRVKLIGLDGSEKYRSNKIEAARLFFNLIDTMPMRQQELKNQKKQK